MGIWTLKALLPTTSVIRALPMPHHRVRPWPHCTDTEQAAWGSSAPGELAFTPSSGPQLLCHLFSGISKVEFLAVIQVTLPPKQEFTL